MCASSQGSRQFPMLLNERMREREMGVGWMWGEEETESEDVLAFWCLWFAVCFISLQVKQPQNPIAA